MTNKLVKWSKEAQEFFEKAEDNSIVLDLVISYACASQTGEGFEELVNTINSEDIKRKVKKVTITDTSYLYRHGIHNFQKYSDISIPTIWFLNNEKAIEKLKIPKEIKSWAKCLDNEKFQLWHKKIKIDFAGDILGNGIIPEFRKAVLDKANSEIFKGNFTLSECVEFILEECAYTCAFFNNANMVYPLNLGGSLDFVDKYYKLNIRILNYRTSNHEQSYRHCIESIKDKIDQEIILFMTDKSTNVNFFVVDKTGKFIYKNESCNNDIEHDDAKRLPLHVWNNTEYVLKTGKRIINEEKSTEDKVYLSVKSPLILNGKVEGVIGLAVDITDKKKAEELRAELKMREKLYEIAKEVAHDICSPLSALDMVKYMSLDKLSEQERKMFELSTRRIKDITNKLIEEYRDNHSNNKEKVVEKEQNYIMPSSLKDIIETMRYMYEGRGIKFKFCEDQRDKFAFIKGEWSEFSRMMTNVIKNGVEAIEGEKGEIEVLEIVKGEEVEVRVKDNGKGMPKEMVEKLMKGEEIGTTKKEGHGIGTQQIMGAIKSLNGKVKIETKEGEGTEFVLRFARCEKPKWFVDKIEIKKGSVIVALDDDILVHEIWKKRFKEYEGEIEVKYFTQGVEALEYLNSLGDKEKVFLIADYELRNQGINGINVIEESGMKERHIMITNAYLADIKDFSEKSKYLKIFHKMHINDVAIVYI